MTHESGGGEFDYDAFLRSIGIDGPTSYEHPWSPVDIQMTATQQIALAVTYLVPKQFQKSYMPTRSANLAITQSNDDIRFGLPVGLQYPIPGRYTLHYNEASYELLEELVEGENEVTDKQVLDLYIGTGAILGLINRRMGDQTSSRHATMRNAFDAVQPSGSYYFEDSLDQALEETRGDFTDAQLHELHEALGHVGNLTYLNQLRFATGLLLSVSATKDYLSVSSPTELESSVSPITLNCRDRLRRKLEAMPDFIQERTSIFTRHNTKKEVGEVAAAILIAREQFYEEIADYVWAAAFPMSLTEVQKAVAACQ